MKLQFKITNFEVLGIEVEILTLIGFSPKTGLNYFYHPSPEVIMINPNMKAFKNKYRIVFLDLPEDTKNFYIVDVTQSP